MAEPPSCQGYDIPWNPSELHDIFPPTLPSLPADTAFIERAARFSSFNSSNFGNLTNTLAAGDSTVPYSSGCRYLSGFRSRKDKNVVDCGGSSGKESSEPEFSGGHQEGDSSAKSNAKRRKKTIQDVDLGHEQRAPESPAETSKESVGTSQKSKHNKQTSKNHKDASEAPQDEYIHVRARRGQATNSHSLAERMRREKISARMKFLQELVPGCSKVTGKAVMLDEIINYVQSLQIQVEFLSMKLAAVNPSLDFNIETPHPKDLSQFHGGPSTIGFSPDLRHPRFHPTHQTLLPAGLPGIANTPDAFQRTISAQLNSTSGYKESAQIANTRNNEIQNMIQMTYGADLPLGSYDLNMKEFHPY